MQDKNIIISTKAVAVGVALTFAMGIALSFVWIIKDVLLYIFISLILALALEPFVEMLRKRKIPRTPAVLIVVVAFITVLVGLSSFAVAPFINEIQGLIINFPTYIDQLMFIAGIDGSAAQFTQTIINQLSQNSGTILVATRGVFSGALSVTIAIVFTVYILIDFPNLRARFGKLFPEKNRLEIRNVLYTVESKLGGWLRGQFMLMLIIGTTTYIGLLIIGLPYSLALAVIAGLLEVVPIIGPLISTVPAVIIGFSVDPWTGVAVTILYILVQQVENNIVVPKVMQKAVGFNPLVTIIALMIGSQLLGIVGAIIAVPFLIVGFEFVKYGLSQLKN